MIFFSQGEGHIFLKIIINNSRIPLFFFEKKTTLNKHVTNSGLIMKIVLTANIQKGSCNFYLLLDSLLHLATIVYKNTYYNIK